MDLASVEARASLLGASWAWRLPRGPQMHLGGVAAATFQQLFGVCSDLFGVQLRVHEERSFFNPYGFSEWFVGRVNRLRMHAIHFRGPAYRDIFDG